MQSKETDENAFHILVIDDNEADRRLATVLLVDAWPFKRDLVVDCAANGEEALEKLRANRFALIILDWKLPTLGGGEILRAIRQDTRRIPVVVISGLQRDQINEDLEALGAAFLNKNQMNTDTFHEAIAISLQLVGLLSEVER